MSESAPVRPVRSGPRTWPDRWSVLWSLVLALLMLGPALGPGYVLSYDMVWVPEMALRPDLLGVGSALPRAVPSDAFVAVLDDVVPGMLLQKVVLLVAIAGGGLGIARLLGSAPLVARLVAIGVYQWSPFLVERLVLGHWPVLLGYAVLPWLVLLTDRWRREARMPAGVGALLVLASLSASTGVATAVALIAGVAGRAARRWVWALLLLAAANAPWIVSGLLHAASGTSDPAGARLFALAGESTLPAPLTALTLGGVWNAEVVPPTRDTLLTWVSLAGVLVLGGLGVGPAVRLLGRRTMGTLGAMWVVGLLLALWTWAAPGSVAFVAAHVPGGGLLRDGARMLALCAPALACAVGLGAARVVDAAGLVDVRPMMAGALVALPVLVMPDAAWGVSGRLSPTDYPASYQRAREVIAAEAPPGDVLLLPLSSYRQPAWNRHHKVLDPAGRYQTRDFVTSDVLSVSGHPLAGEDPRVAAVARALDESDPRARADALAELGIGVVVVDRTAPGETEQIAGVDLMSSAELDVIGLRGARAIEPPRGWVVAMAGAWTAFVLALLGGLVPAVLGAVRRLRASKSTKRGTGAWPLLE